MQGFPRTRVSWFLLPWLGKDITWHYPPLTPSKKELLVFWLLKFSDKIFLHGFFSETSMHSIPELGIPPEIRIPEFREENPVQEIGNHQKHPPFPFDYHCCCDESHFIYNLFQICSSLFFSSLFSRFPHVDFVLTLQLKPGHHHPLRFLPKTPTFLSCRVSTKSWANLPAGSTSNPQTGTHWVAQTKHDWRIFKGSSDGFI